MTAISVIIPTYNRANLVPLAIESVLAQTHPAAEIIVVDDGSKQDMREVLAPFSTRITVIRQSNTGLSGARNTGIRAAHSEWVAFLDDDDEHAPERLSRAAESIRRHPNSDAHLTNTAIIAETGPATDLFQVRGMPSDEWMQVVRPLSWVLRGCFFAQSLVARRSTLHEIGLFRPTFYEDMDLFVRLANRTPWIIDGRPGLRLIRRNNTDAMSDDWRSKPVKRCEALVRIYRETLTLTGLTSSELHGIRTGLGTYLFDLGCAHSALGDNTTARPYFLEAARNFPALHSRLKSRLAAFGGLPLLHGLQSLRRPRKGLVR